MIVWHAQVDTYRDHIRVQMSSSITIHLLALKQRSHNVLEAHFSDRHAQPFFFFFYVIAADWNSGSYTFRASMLPSELSF